MKSRKNIVIGVLCIALIFMGLGYAAFNTTLNLTGTASTSGTFDVKITNVELDSTKKTDRATDLTPAVGENYAVTEQTLTAKFFEPGDYITWNITVTNRGTIEAAITVDTSEDTSGPYKLSCNAVEGTVLVPSATTTFACEMSFDKNRTLIASQFEDLEKGVPVNMTVSVTAVQASEYETQSLTCYSPLDEEKTLGVISGDTKSSVDIENIQIGDLLGFGTSDIDSNEQFYVIEKNGNTLKLLSRYDINVAYIDSNSKNHQKPWDNCSRDTRGLQDKTLSLTRHNKDVSLTSEEKTALNDEINERGFLYGSLLFSETNFWWDMSNNQFISPYYQYGPIYDSNSNLKSFVDQYVNALNTMGLNATNGTILTVQQVGAICNNTDFTHTDDASGCPSYIFETSYWLGSASTNSALWYVYEGNLVSDGYNISDTFGVRPVINVTLG